MRAASRGQQIDEEAGGAAWWSHGGLQPRESTFNGVKVQTLPRKTTFF